MKIDFEAVCIIFGLGLFFAVIGLIDEFSLSRFLLSGGFGAFLGFAGLPYFEPKKYSPQPLLCAVIAAGAVIALAMSREQSEGTIALSGLAGFIFGWFSPYFAKYL